MGLIVSVIRHSKQICDITQEMETSDAVVKYMLFVSHLFSFYDDKSYHYFPSNLSYEIWLIRCNHAVSLLYLLACQGYPHINVN